MKGQVTVSLDWSLLGHRHRQQASQNTLDVPVCWWKRFIEVNVVLEGFESL